MKPAKEKIEEQLKHGVLADINTHISENTGSRSNFAEERVVPFIKSLIIAELEELRGEEMDYSDDEHEESRLLSQGYNEAVRERNRKIDKKIEELKEV